MEFVLPENYVELNQDEMMYLDGGLYINNETVQAIGFAIGCMGATLTLSIVRQAIYYGAVQVAAYLSGFGAVGVALGVLGAAYLSANLGSIAPAFFSALDFQAR